MLTSTTKNRINSCRDILVGKIPDPKGQIDQITNALVYKFMDDQDRMSRELGYEASFFVGEYEKYAWSKFFDTKLTNQDKANLYIEGLDRLSRADHLPELFRQIFKDAYLPFRDANTIVMFLMEINGFDYHHSEELGNAFEYLLSIMGSQGDAGQFRTPRHIIEFLVDVVDPQKTETILDPACGTAGFLVEAFKHISAKGDLGVQDIARLAESITGVDIDPGMAKIARVNLYLHGFKTPHITENDTLTDEKLWGHKYDVILANPPFMTPKGGIVPHDKFAIRANRAEVLFTDYIAEHLKLAGRAGIIVPEGIIFQSSNAYKALRKMLVDDGYLWAVVSLPAGCFNPYAGVKTTILFLDRERAKQADSILFVKISADGYDLGAQRREIGKNDLPKALEILNAYKENPNLADSHPELVSGSSIAHLVPKSRISESGDYNLSGDRYIASTPPVSTEYEMVELGEVCSFEYGKSLPSEKRVPGIYPVMGSNGRSGNHNEFLVEGPSIIVGRKGSAGEVIWEEENCFPIDTTYFIKSKIKINYKFLYHILKSINLSKLKGGAGIPGLNRNDAYSQKFPLLPLEIQEQIVAELDGYQRIIDGARAVVENYKPTIKIDLEWEMVELGEVCTFTQGVQIPKEEQIQESKDGFKRYLYIQDFKGENKSIYVKDQYKNKELTNNDLVMTNTGTPGRAFIAVSGILSNNLFRISFDGQIINQKYLLHTLESESFQKILQKQMKGGIQKHLGHVTIAIQRIPLPPLEIQQTIVERIEEEQRLVDANRRLIEIYESKIRDRMDAVWGVGK